MKIFKYTLEIASEFEVEMPAISVPLHLALQRDIPCLWAVVDPDSELVTRKFRCVGTGESVPGSIPREYYAPSDEPSGDANYLGTVVRRNGNVWHYYIYHNKATTDTVPTPITDLLRAGQLPPQS